MLRIPVDITRVISETGESATVSDTVQVPEIEFGFDRYRPIVPVAYTVTLSNVGGALVLIGSVSVRAQVDCSRCLEKFAIDIDGEVDSVLVQEGREEGMPQEQEYEVVHGSEIDLWPHLYAAIATALPFIPLHDADCRGICPDCGIDLNSETCGCREASADSPFEALKALVLEEEESDEP